METSFFGKDGFIWWKGVIEDRKDPIFLGRLRVRIFGWHTEDRIELPTEDLPWAVPSLPLDHGRNSVGPREGDWCWGFFLDGKEAQKPIVVGYIPGIDEAPANPDQGFYDPTPEENLVCGVVPRPPDMCPLPEQEQEEETEEEKDPGKSGKFGNPDVLPGQNIAFGQLTKDYSADRYKFDVNSDGAFNETDAKQIIETSREKTQFFGGQVFSIATAAISRYPLENRLMEPSTSRLSRNEKIEETIVAYKKGELGTGEGAGYEASGLGDKDSTPQAFQEPETPYDAKYPYNHVYESESGHVIEVDDTPGAERMHWYHRSGTFREIHPDGLEVNKIKKAQYNFVIEDYFNGVGKSINMDAGEAIRAKAAQVINLKAGSDLNGQAGTNINLSSGKNINASSGEDVNVRSGENVNILSPENINMKAEQILDARGMFAVFISSETGVVHIKALGEINLESGAKITLNAPRIDIVGDLNAPNPPYDPGIAGPNLAGAETTWDKEFDDKPTDASAKYGFVLPNGTVGDVYKPISESDQKLVTLSALGSDHTLAEAIPTGRLEAVKIKYVHPDGTFTEWDVVRPVHVPGKVIDTPRITGLFEDGVRFLCRWNKAGEDYPKQMFWIVGSNKNLILDSAHRHQCIPGPFNDRINFDLRTKKSAE